MVDVLQVTLSSPFVVTFFFFKSGQVSRAHWACESLIIFKSRCNTPLGAKLYTITGGNTCLIPNGNHSTSSSTP